MTWCESTLAAWGVLASTARVRPLRNLREFAEQEIVLPTGPFEGLFFRVNRHPIIGLLLDELPKWRRSAITGPGQDGKSLDGFVIPILYHLFEVGEDVICGVPNTDMGADKWRDDLLPVIEASRFKDLLPRRGSGSRGGKVLAVKFRNGRVLRFMSGASRDKAKAGKTSRVVVITETDGMDVPGGGSKEADPIRQIEARTKAFGAASKAYLECTVSTEGGRIWQEYQAGTASRIEVCCPHCSDWIVWEREHLVGWQDAKNLIEAGEKARLVCPKCGGLCDEEQKLAAIRTARLVHARTDTDTLGFRWNAAYSPLKPISEVAKEEWKAAKTEDELADKALRQFTWAIPAKNGDENTIEYEQVMIRTTGEARGYVPNDSKTVVIGLDIGKRLNHWVAISPREEASPHIIDYGLVEVPSDEMAMENALLLALREFRENTVNKGFDSRDGTVLPEYVIIDTGWAGKKDDRLDAVVYAFCRESNAAAGYERYLPSKGWSKGRYRHPEKKDDRVREIGEQYYIAKIQEKRARLLQANTDHWKGRVHDRLRTPMGQSGAMTLFAPKKKSNGQPDLYEHLKFSKHLTAEELIDGEWIVKRSANHYLDASVLAMVAAARAGCSLIHDEDGNSKTANALRNRATQAGRPEVRQTLRPEAGDAGGKDNWFSRRRRK